MVGGLDGCAGGWVFVTFPVDGEGSTSVMVVSDLIPVLAMIEGGELSAAGIDIPIGLPDRDPRPCDLAARKMIGPRRSSVFPAPPRGVLGAHTYAEACARSMAVCGKSISRQGFGIVPKTESVDRIMTPARQDVLFEVHPEVSFTVMAGRPMAHYKATPEGRTERLAVLRGEFADLDQHISTRLPGTNPSDILDAFATAWSARRRLRGAHVQLGGDLDARGLRMEMIA
jgi:predicted RNase H-like nuclease